MSMCCRSHDAGIGHESEHVVGSGCGIDARSSRGIDARGGPGIDMRSGRGIDVRGGRGSDARRRRIVLRGASDVAAYIWIAGTECGQSIGATHGHGACGRIVPSDRSARVPAAFVGDALVRIERASFPVGGTDAAARRCGQRDLREEGGDSCTPADRPCEAPIR